MSGRPRFGSTGEDGRAQICGTVKEITMAKSDDKRRVETEETWITGSLNFVIFLSIAAVGYTDWIVVPNISLGYLYVLPIALSALVNPLAITIALAVVCAVLQEVFGPASDVLQVRIFRDAITFAGFLVVAFLMTLIA